MRRRMVRPERLMPSWKPTGLLKAAKRYVENFCCAILTNSTTQPNRRKHNHRGHDDHTRDLRAMFTKVTWNEDVKTLNGHICNVCK